MYQAVMCLCGCYVCTNAYVDTSELFTQGVIHNLTYSLV